MEAFHLIKASQKSGKPNGVFWFTAKTEARAKLQAQVLLEDNEISVGRGQDYQLPVMTNFPVVDDLPDENVIDFTWCDRYELQDDGRNWLPKVAVETIATTDATSAPETLYENGLQISEHDDGGDHYAVSKMPFRKQLLSQFGVDELRHHISRSAHAEIHALEMDTDNNYVQNLLLAAENCDVVKGYDTADLWLYTSAIRKVFSQEKRHELALVLRFTRIWADTESSQREILTEEWAAGRRITEVAQTDAGTHAGGGNKSDRNPDLTHTLDTLDIEIALATLPMDFNIHDIPGGVFRRAKEIVSKKESPFKEWSSDLRKRAGILDYSRAAIFALIRNCHPEYHKYPGRLSGYIDANLTETDHEHPSEETLMAAGHVPENSWEREINDKVMAKQQAAAEQPQVANLGGAVFSIEGLMGGNSNPVINTPSNEVEKTEIVTEITSDVQMEEVHAGEDEGFAEDQPGEEAIQPGESGDETSEPATAVDELAADTTTSTEYHHVMVDLKAMGKKPNAPIVAIGACCFDPNTGDTGPEFYRVINLESSMEFGAKPDGGTIMWWMRQSAEARTALLDDDAVSLLTALDSFTRFITENIAGGSRAAQVWGNGATFDNVILKGSYALCCDEAPWENWNDRDVQTISELGRAVGIDVRSLPFDGDRHNALDDARHQAKYVSAIWQKLTAN